MFCFETLEVTTRCKFFLYFRKTSESLIMVDKFLQIYYYLFVKSNYVNIHEAFYQRINTTFCVNSSFLKRPKLL